MKNVVLVLTLFLFPGVCAAEAVSVTPMEWDFGNVPVGETATALFQIANTDPVTPVELGRIGIEDDPFSAFTITFLDPVPAELYVEDGALNCEVTFAPPSLGFFDGVLEIESNDTHNFPPAGTVYCALSGRGVMGAVPEASSVVIWLLLGLLGGIVASRRKRTSQ
jgi:hypothetical protein